MPFGWHELFCIRLQLSQGTSWVTESAEQHVSKLVQYQFFNKRLFLRSYPNCFGGKSVSAVLKPSLSFVITRGVRKLRSPILFFTVNIIYFQNKVYRWKAWTFFYFSTSSPLRSTYIWSRTKSLFIPASYQFLPASRRKLLTACVTSSSFSNLCPDRCSLRAGKTW